MFNMIYTNTASVLNNFRTADVLLAYFMLQVTSYKLQGASYELQ